MSDLVAIWKVKAWPAMRDLADAKRGFYSDDLVDLVGLPDPEHPANADNGAVGALFRTAGKQGLIRKTGRVRTSRQPRRRGGLNQEWIGTGDQGELPL